MRLSFLTSAAWVFGLVLSTFTYLPTHAQCDFIRDITGLTQTTPLTSDPATHTQVYVLVDCHDEIFAVSTTPDFTNISAGLYDLRAVNYANSELRMILPLLAVGQPWPAVETYGTGSNCLDYTPPFGGCAISVCTENNVLENDVITVPTTGFNSTGHTQEYCLVCAGSVVAKSSSANFDLGAIPQAVAGANCQVFAYNFLVSEGDPLAVTTPWQSTTDPMVCLSTACLNYAGMQLNISSILPIELVRFEVSKYNNVSSLLSWETASEVNSLGFEVLRSSTGEGWEKIGFVASPENAPNGHRYTFIDENPLQGENYYRLKQLDHDGKESFSPVRYLYFDGESKLSVSLAPNPHNKQFTLHLRGVEGSTTAQLQLIDALGRIVWEAEEGLQQGQLSRRIDTDHLQKGFYLLKIQVGEQQIVRRCIKE